MDIALLYILYFSAEDCILFYHRLLYPYQIKVKQGKLTPKTNKTQLSVYFI